MLLENISPMSFFDLSRCQARILLCFALYISSINAVKGDCMFPPEWFGEWFQSGRGSQGPVVVNRTHFSNFDCVEIGKSNRYLVYLEPDRCHKCMVINMKHHNVIQYKESFCEHQERQLTTLCQGITGDAILFSMFRLNTELVPCPFKGPLTFTYSKGYGECADPVSQVDSCADDSRLLFRQQACADVPKSESKEEELVCLGSWKEGSNHYLVGKVNHSHANSDEDRYRCFIYERPHHHPHQHRRQDSEKEVDSNDWYLAMSADATCQGLVTAFEGGKTMKLRKANHGSKKCKYPSWLSDNTHWHTLDDTQSYFLYHRNTSIKISNGTAPPENLEIRGHTDLRLVCNEYESYHNPKEKHKEHHGGHHKEHHDHADHVTIIVHFTVGCRSGYRCMRVYRRDDHVVQVQFGIDALNSEEACKGYYWNPLTAPLITLVARGDTTGSCGPFGRYHVAESQDETLPCNPSDGRSLSFTHLTIGCSQHDTLELHGRCPHKEIDSYQCHGEWKSEGVTYVVASPISRPSGSPRRVCFAYSQSENNSNRGIPHLIFTARHDTCISRTHDAHLSINATLVGQCTEASGMASRAPKLSFTPCFLCPLFSVFIPSLLHMVDSIRRRPLAIDFNL